MYVKRPPPFETRKYVCHCSAPVFRDRLTYETTFYQSLEWSLKTGFTGYSRVRRPLKDLSLTSLSIRPRTTNGMHTLSRLQRLLAYVIIPLVLEHIIYGHISCGENAMYFHSYRQSLQFRFYLFIYLYIYLFI